MKKILLSLLAVGMMSTLVLAQTDPAADLKAAKKAYRNYIDDNTDVKSIETAREKIDAAFKTDALLNDPKQATKALMAKIEIYNEITKLDLLNYSAASLKKEKYEFKYADAGLPGTDAFLKIANSQTASKGDKKDAVEAVAFIADQLMRVSLTGYDKQKYNDAYNGFARLLEVKKAADAIGPNKIIENKELQDDILFYTGLSAFQAENYDKSIEYLKLSAKGNYKSNMGEGTVYHYMVQAYNKLKQPEKGLEMINEGRKLFPSDQSLVYDAINYYIGINQLDKLDEILEAAITKDPKNKTLYYVKGKMYEGLVEKYGKEGKIEEATKATTNAETYYSKALEIDANYFDPLYSLGALNYNKAAAITTEMNKLTMSKADQKRYDELQIAMKALFDKALPFFERADAVNSNDVGTITALKEIYAKKDNAAKSTEYRKRLEAMKAAGK
ncbi:MAG: hypothetical protein RI894_2650 [Bacteroidota bacterium]|jgi:hypothetical protein